MKGIILTLLISSFLMISSFTQSEALLQTAGPLTFQLEPGESQTQTWGLQDVKSKEPTTIVFSIEGEGSELVSFPETIILSDGKLTWIDITVSIPEDYPTDIKFEPKIRATDSGVLGGAVKINISMTKPLTILIGNPIIEEEEEEIILTPVETPTVPEKQVTETEEPIPEGSFTITAAEEEGGGCLISTATFGSELAPQVQMLREIRDNKLLSSESGHTFMTGFNTIYYSFSPTIADWERESPIFREVVKITLTPLLTSLSILNYIDLDSESKVLASGISLIIFNIGMYFVAPALVIVKLNHKLQKK